MAAAVLHTVAPGEDLLSEIELLSTGGQSWVQAVGRVEDVELSVARTGGDALLAPPGPFSLVGFHGPLGGPYAAVLAREADGGVEIIAGELRRARSAGVSVALFPVDAAPREAVPTQPAPGRTSEGPSDGSRAEPRAAAASAVGPHGWAAAAAASEAVATIPPEDADDESDELPQYRDQVQHPVFGLCDVMVVKGERLKIRDVHDTGRMREIHLGVMKVLKPETRGGKRVFKLVKRGD